MENKLMLYKRNDLWHLELYNYNSNIYLYISGFFPVDYMGNCVWRFWPEIPESAILDICLKIADSYQIDLNVE